MSAPTILVIGGQGTIGKAVVAAIRSTLPSAIVLSGGRSAGNDVIVDITDAKSVGAALTPLQQGTTLFDHIIVCAGDALFKPIGSSTKADYTTAFNSKALGQIDVVLQGYKAVKSGGSITLTSGVLDQCYIPAGAGAAAINGAVNAFVRTACNETIAAGVRLNAVSPGVLTESMADYAPFFQGFKSVDGKDVALAYIRSMLGGVNGKVFSVLPGGHFQETA